MSKAQKKRARKKRNKNKKNKQPQKVTNQLLTLEYLDARITQKFGPAKWMQFARHFIETGFDVELYEARQTVSKYLTVISKDGRKYKVRFSNHAPILEREINGDCDYFVGRTNLRVTTTDMAIINTELFFARSPINA
jgi:hypothetical protein